MLTDAPKHADFDLRPEILLNLQLISSIELVSGF